MTDSLLDSQKPIFVRTNRESDITEMVKEFAQAKENGPDPERVSKSRVGRVFGSIRLREVPRPSGKAQPGGAKPSRAHIWSATKKRLRELLLSYHMDIPEEYTSTSVQPSGGSGGSGGDDEVEEVI
jgi:hypothetical protein